MKRNISIQIKALFLLLVFAFNTAVGFACAMGVDMGFNTTHHHDDEKEVSVHVHADGNKHHHDNDKASSDVIKTDADYEKDHHHGEAEEQYQNKKDGSQKDDCCNDKVVKITQTDKAVSNSGTLVHPVFFTALISSYYNINVTYSSQSTTSIKHFVRGHHPPI